MDGSAGHVSSTRRPNKHVECKDGETKRDELVGSGLKPAACADGDRADLTPHGGDTSDMVPTGAGTQQATPVGDNKADNDHSSNDVRDEDTPCKGESDCGSGHAVVDASGLEHDKSGPHWLQIGKDWPVDPESDAFVVHYGRLRRIEGLEGCVHLREVSLIANSVERIEGLSTLVGLEKLTLYQNQIRCIEGLETLVNLRELDLSFNKITKIEGLETLTKLTRLQLCSNRITMVEGLDTLDKLEVLELGSNRLRELRGVDHLTELRELYLGKNKLTSMEIPAFAKLRVLSMQANRLTEWHESIWSPSLQELYLSENGLTELRAPRGVPVLDLSKNAIERIAECARGVRELWLDYNKLEWAALQPLVGLGLHTLYLEHNPLAVALGPAYRARVIELFQHQLFKLDATQIDPAFINRVPEDEGSVGDVV